MTEVMHPVYPPAWGFGCRTVCGQGAYAVVYLVVSLFFAFAVAAFAIQNSYLVNLRFLGWDLTTSLALVLIGATIAGALIVGLLAFFRQVGLGLKLMDERSRGQKASQELEQIRLASSELHRELDRAREQNRKLAARLQELQPVPGQPSGGREAQSMPSPPSPAAPAAAEPDPGQTAVRRPHPGFDEPEPPEGAD